MKRRIMLSIALSLSVVLLSLMKSDSTANAQNQNQMRQVADTGAVEIGPGQKIRVTVAAGDINSGENVRVRFVRTGYTQDCGSGDICKLTAAAQTTSAPVQLSPGEAVAADGNGDAVIDGADFAAWRTVVLSNRRNVKVTGIVFDTSTWRAVSEVSMETVSSE